MLDTLIALAMINAAPMPKAPICVASIRPSHIRLIALNNEPIAIREEIAAEAPENSGATISYRIHQ